jgi:thiol-disulfide isomerase/thioredoxin/outer membrane lipoprotein-sorting protein
VWNEAGLGRSARARRLRYQFLENAFALSNSHADGGERWSPIGFAHGELIADAAGLRVDRGEGSRIRTEAQGHFTMMTTMNMNSPGFVRRVTKANAGIRVAIGVAVLLSLAGVSAAFATAPEDRSKPATAKDAAAADVLKVLTDAREAFKRHSAMSFTAAATTTPPKGQPTKDASGLIVLSSADAGGWKVSAKGSGLGLFGVPRAEGAAAPTESQIVPDAPIAFHLGFDGAMAWSLRESDKVLLTRTIREHANLTAFFGSQLAGAILPWEFMGDTPLDFKPETMVGEGSQSVGGIACDVIRITPKAADHAATRDVTGSQVRIFIAKSDKLPRRIERTLGEGESASRTIAEFTDWKLDRDAEPGAFVMSPPDGFMVRSADPRRARPQPSPEQRNPGPGSRQQSGVGGILQPGAAAPDWTLTDGSGNERSMKDYRGKVVLLDFWGSWCPPCVAAMPEVEKIHDEYKDKGVVVLGMNFERDANADPVAFMAKHGHTYGLIRNAEKIAREYRVFAWPTFYVIDREGKVVTGLQGFAPNASRVIREAIDKALSAEATAAAPAEPAPAAGESK